MSNHTPAAYHAHGYPPNIPENMHGVGGMGASAAATTPHSSHHGYSALSTSHVQQGRHESQGHAYASQERATHTSTPCFHQYGGYGGSVPQQYNSQYQAPSHAHQWYGIQPLPPPLPRSLMTTGCSMVRGNPHPQWIGRGRGPVVVGSIAPPWDPLEGTALITWTRNSWVNTWSSASDPWVRKASNGCSTTCHGSSRS